MLPWGTSGASARVRSRPPGLMTRYGEIIDNSLSYRFAVGRRVSGDKSAPDLISQARGRPDNSLYIFLRRYGLRGGDFNQRGHALLSPLHNRRTHPRSAFENGAQVHAAGDLSLENQEQDKDWRCSHNQAGQDYGVGCVKIFVGESAETGW